MEFKIFNIDTTGRKFGLDLLRALAIVLVLISHSKTILAPFKIDLSFLSIGGFYGVELFFVLSGFLIGTILIKTFLKEGFDLLSIKDFWKRRWYRTLPNYYLVLILNIILTFFLRESWDFFDWKFFVFAQNLFTQNPRFFAEAWSLSVEEYFYLTSPLLIYIAAKILTPFGFDNKKILLIAIISILVIILANRVIFNLLYVQKEIISRNIVVFRLDAIMYGVLSAYLSYYYIKTVDKLQYKLLLIGGVIIIFCTIIYYLDVTGSNPSYFSKTILYSMLSIGFSLVIPWANNLKLRESLFTKCVTHLSIISYSVYLIHSSFVLKIQRYILRPSSIQESLVVYTGFWVITILISTLLYKFYEKPFTDLRDKRNISGTVGF